MKTRKEWPEMLAVLAGVLSIGSFLIYNLEALRGSGKPNVSSWLVWSSITILNFTSYRKMTGDWVKSTLPTIGSVLCLTTTVISLWTGSWRALGLIDQVCLAIGLVAGICWWTLWKTKYAEVAVQIILEVALTIGFIPTIMGIYRDPSCEPPLVWFIWSATFVLQFFVVRFREAEEEKKIKKIEFLYPVNMFWLHLLVFALALR